MSNSALGLAAAVVLLLSSAAVEAAPIRNIVLVHGAWVDGSGWKGVYEHLRRDGYHVTMVQEPEASFADDVAATRRVLDMQDGPTILVGHSYGGSVITEAGVHPNVVGLVYVAAHAPDIGENDAYHAFARVLLAKARRENMTLRDLYNLTAAARGHWVLCGSAETVADTLQYWFENGAADGFNVMPPYFPGGFDDFVDLVVPILQERGLFRADYAGTTLRDHLGPARPERAG